MFVRIWRTPTSRVLCGYEASEEALSIAKQKQKGLRDMMGAYGVQVRRMRASFVWEEDQPRSSWAGLRRQRAMSSRGLATGVRRLLTWDFDTLSTVMHRPPCSLQLSGRAAKHHQR